MKISMNMGRCLFLMATFLMPVEVFCFPEGSVNVDSCREKLSAFFDGSWKGSPSQKISSIKQLGSQCSGSGTYELALSTAYLTAGRYSDAEQTARLGLAVKGDDEARFLYVIFRTRVGERDWPGALVIANEALDKFPKSNAGYLLKGEYFGGIGDFEKSITYLEKSREIVSNSEVNNHLVIAYYNTSRYKDAASAFEQSARIDDTSLLDINTVLAAAASYYEIGNHRAAIELLEKHAEVVPGSRRDPLFIKMHNILMSSK